MCGLTLQQYQALPLRPFHDRSLAFHKLIYPYVSIKKAGARAPFPETVRRIITDYLPAPLPFEYIPPQTGQTSSVELCACVVSHPDDVMCVTQNSAAASFCDYNVFLHLAMLGSSPVSTVPVKLRGNFAGFGLLSGKSREPTMVAEVDVPSATDKQRPLQLAQVPCAFDSTPAQSLFESASPECEFVFAVRFPPDLRTLTLKVHAQDLCASLFASPHVKIDAESFDRKWATMTSDAASATAYSFSLLPCCAVPSVLILPSVAKEFWTPLAAWISKQCPFLLEVSPAKKRSNVLKYVTTLQPLAIKGGKAAALIQVTVTSLPHSHVALKLEVACPGHVLIVSNMLRMLLSSLEVEP